MWVWISIIAGLWNLLRNRDSHGQRFCWNPICKTPTAMLHTSSLRKTEIIVLLPTTMGCHISRAKRSNTTHRPTPTTAESQLRSVSNFNSPETGPQDGDLRSYAAAYRSLDSLSQVTERFVDMNQEVVKIILQNKKGIWKNKDLSDLINDYLESSMLTLDFCNSLDSCLQPAGHIESIVNAALRKFKTEQHSAVCEQVSVKYASTLEELRNLTKLGDPFTEDFYKVFNSIFSRQVVILDKLQSKKKKLDKKLAKLKIYRRISKVIFIAAFASVMICPVVAAAVVVPPVVAAAVAALPLASIWKWVDSIWNKREMDLMGQKEILGSMEIGSYVVIKDSDNIRVQVERFHIGIESLLGYADSATTVGVEEEVVVAAVGEIKKEAMELFKIIHELREQASKCRQEIGMARTLILRRILNHPKGSDQDIDMFSL